MEVTPLAIEKLKEVLDQEQEVNSSLRVIAMPSGGGLQYMLTMEKETHPTIPCSAWKVSFASRSID